MGSREREGGRSGPGASDLTRAPSLWQSWLDRARALSPASSAATVCLVLACLSAVWVIQGELQRRSVRQSQALAVAQSQAGAIRQTFERSMALVGVLQTMVRQGHGQVPDFGLLAQNMLASRPDVMSLNLLPGGVIRLSAPEAVVPFLLNLDVLQGPHRHAGAVLAWREGRAVVSPPTLLPIGREGLLVHAPVYLSSAEAGPTAQPWGLVRIAISLSELLAQSHLGDLAALGLNHELRAATPDTASGGERGGALLSRSPPEGRAEPLVGALRVPVQLGDLTWVLSVVPHQGWSDAWTLWLSVGWAALFSGGSAALVYFFLNGVQLSRRLIQNLTHHVPGLLYQYHQTPDGHTAFVYVSPGVEALTGLSAGALQRSDQAWREQLLPDDWRRLRAALQVSARDLSPLSEQFRMGLPNGQLRWYWTKAQPQREADGSVLWNGYMADCTAEHTTEQALAQSTRLLTEAQEVARLGYFVTDLATGAWTSSDLLDDILGIGPDHPRTPEGWQALLEPEFRGPMRAIYREAVAKRTNFNMEYAVRRPLDDRVIWVNVIGRLEFDASGRATRIVGTVQDITTRKKAETDIRNLAYYDPLTGLPNRRLLLERLDQALTERAMDHTHGAVLFIDLDNFKDLNDAMGHETGDALLRLVALRLLSCVRESDTVARMGGDEFVLLLHQLELAPGDDPASVAEQRASLVMGALGRPYPLAGSTHTSTPSIGVALFSDEGLAVDEIIKRADVAMYQAKAAGRNALRFYDPALQHQVAERWLLVEDLRTALTSDQLFLQYQPQHNGAGAMVGAEALLRWRHPQRGLVSPAVFIPLAEQAGLMETLGQWVLNTACAQLAQWLADDTMAAALGDFALAVNVSAHQFSRGDCVESVARVVRHWGIAPGRLKLELTESMMVHDVDDIVAKMHAIRRLGVLFSLDDFGTGYSSLSQLKRLPLDQLKIDQSFVRELLHSTNDAAIARTVVALGQTLGLEVIAEGVETEAQRDYLRGMGCYHCQGYLFSKPLNSDQFRSYALDNKQ